MTMVALKAEARPNPAAAGNGAVALRNIVRAVKALTKVATIASAFTCVLVIAAFAASYHTKNWRHAIYVTSSVTLGTADGWVALGRNEDQYIPDHLHGARLSYEGGEATGRRDWRFGI